MCICLSQASLFQYLQKPFLLSVPISAPFIIYIEKTLSSHRRDALNKSLEQRLSFCGLQVSTISIPGNVLEILQTH
jgi:hypothetical protein